MPTFRYSAYNAGGKEVSGAVDAENVREARLQLKKSGLFPRDISPADQLPASSARRLFRRGTGLPQLALMTRRLATLLGSHVPVFEALSTLWEQEEPGELRQVLGRVRERLAEGGSLSRAMAGEPAVFSESYVSMVAAGEASGSLDTVLEKLAEFLEDQQAIQGKATSALIYPLLMIVVGSGVMFFLLTFVIPKIVVIFEDNKATLPFITIAVIKISSFLRKGWWGVLLALGAVVYAYRKLMLQEPFRRRRDRLLLRLPLVGPLLQQLILSRFAKVLGMLLTSGVPVIRALEITGEVVVNREYRTTLHGIAAELAEGGTLSRSLRETRLFPPLLVHMTAVGEKGGELEAMLTKAGNAFEREFSTRVTSLMALLEPLMVLAMGVAVGIIVLAVLLPIFELNQLIK